MSAQPPLTGVIKNAVQVRKHLVSWANYKLQLPRWTEGVEFCQTLDDGDLRALQTSRVQRLRKSANESLCLESKNSESYEDLDDESVTPSGTSKSGPNGTARYEIGGRQAEKDRINCRL